MNRRFPLTGFASLLVLLFLYAPIAIVIVYSFNAARYGIEWRGFTIDWYVRLFDNYQATAAAVNTLQLACTSTFFATLLGTALASMLLANFQGPKT